MEYRRPAGSKARPGQSKSPQKPLISNDKFISVNHKVLAQNVGLRIFVACFFRQHLLPENSSIL
ncbi:hypothetical protein RchiOBHm_Chr4g0392201 [Rosa chinensis]|uniref:Uncharacterized protein n=1 Tax=Rosa chinensis TaxID=74649 RepID=A0A2P6QQS0_ROSCH|nr:hypothetical protein RchiOBHm_Chr4g0392201 [Rosa chinensis]